MVHPRAMYRSGWSRRAYQFYRRSEDLLHPGRGTQ